MWAKIWSKNRFKGIGKESVSKDDPLSDALFVAAGRGNLAGVKLTLRDGVNVNAVREDLKTALHLAAMAGKFECVKLLIENNAHVAMVDKNGRASIYYACESGYLEIVKYLIKHGADICVKDANKISPLTVAIKKGRVNCVQYLIENVIDLSANLDEIYASYAAAHKFYENYIYDDDYDSDIRSNYKDIISLIEVVLEKLALDVEISAENELQPEVAF